MLLTTTPSIDGKKVSVYLGVVASEVIFGANFLKDWLAEGDDFWGGRGKTYEKVYADARAKTLQELQVQASEKGANAVLNIRFDYSVLGASNSMMMVAATGTAVVLDLSREELAAQKQRDQDEAALHYLDIDGKRRGPFSLAQIRELEASGRVQDTAHVYDEQDAIGATIKDLLAK